MWDLAFFLSLSCSSSPVCSGVSLACIALQWVAMEKPRASDLEEHRPPSRFPAAPIQPSLLTFEQR